LQLHEYWAVIRRRPWVVLALPAIALAVSAALAFRGPSAYCVDMQLAVSVIPEPRDVPGPGYYKYDLYYPWLSSEYLADDLSEVMKSQAFAQDVSAELGYSIEPGLIMSSTRTKKTHRTIEVRIAGSNREAVSAVGEAYERVLNTRLGDYFRQLQAQNGAARIINRPTLSRCSSLGTQVGELALRTLLGLLLGTGLAFLLDYVDTRLRDRRDLERTIGLPTLAEIPRSMAG
jgi:capsular polysaccharide biosynthesis protein